jgi:hypothetical protein
MSSITVISGLEAHDAVTACYTSGGDVVFVSMYYIAILTADWPKVLEISRTMRTTMLSSTCGTSLKIIRGP